MPKGQPFSPEVKAKSIARVQELVKTGAAPSTWSALVQVARDLKCSPETVRVWLSKPLTPPARRGRPPKSAATPTPTPVRPSERVFTFRAAEDPPPARKAPATPASSQDTATALSVARLMLANAMDILKQLEAAR